MSAGDDSLDRQVTHRGDPASADVSPESLGGEATARFDDSMHVERVQLGDDDEPRDLGVRYEVEKVLASGGMGRVHRAMDRRLRRPVAIKRLNSEIAASRAALRRFVVEAQSVAALNHFNIVQVYDYGRDDLGPYIVMELVDGMNLAERLESGPLPVDEAIPLFTQLCDALGLAHDNGIVHRDVKPSNVMLSRDGTPKLTDFGLARSEHTDLTRTHAGAVLGTIDFMSPEQGRNASQVDARSDQWSLAATLYQALTGESPRTIDAEALPSSLRSVLLKTLKTKPDDRFASMADFRRALVGASSETTVSAPSLGELHPGQCAACHAMNDRSMKFCETCGQQLWEPCINCTNNVGVWAQFCGECGEDLHQLLSERIDAARELQDAVPRLRAHYRHAEAIAKLAELSDVKHSALDEYGRWADDQRRRLTDELSRLNVERDQLIEAARTQASNGYDSRALQYLRRIPAQLLGDDGKEFIVQLEGRAVEASRLRETIQAAAAARQFDTLLPKLERYLDLRPRDERAVKLRARLRRRLPEQDVEDTSRSQERTVETYGQNSATEVSRWQRIVTFVAVASLVAGVLIALSWIQRSTNKPDIDSPDRMSDREVTGEQSSSFEADAEVAFDGAPPGNDENDSTKATAEPSSGDVAGLSHREREAQRLGVELSLQNSIGMDFQFIPSGEFLMGANHDDPFAEPDERPQHRVEISRGFYLGTFEVTQREYSSLMSADPSVFKGRLRPVENLTWHNAEEFCRKLSDLAAERTAKRHYRLPTEAEWEFACRAGTTTRYSFGDNRDRLGEFGWFNRNSDGQTHPVGRKAANPWGLFDMHGNVFEWCQDHAGRIYRASSVAVRDPVAPFVRRTNANRTYRGGAFDYSDERCRSSLRHSRPPTEHRSRLGFRVLLDIRS